MARVWLTLARFVGESRLDLPIVPTTESCSGGTYIVTGANVGLGFETAKHLVGLGAGKVILAVRDIRAGEAAMASIEEATQKRNVVEVWSLDLANLNSVKAMAQRAISDLDRIDALIENAAIALMSKDKWTMAEGHELSITVNVIGTLLLAVMLLPKMMAGARRFGITPHLVIVTSGVGFTARSELDKIKEDPLVKMRNRETADMSQRYALSKLIQIMAVRHLAKVLPVSTTGVVMNLVTPGLCKTQLARNSGLAFRLQLGIANMLIGRTAEMGSRTILHAMVAGRESHGLYLGSCEIQENQVPTWVTDDEGESLQKRIWDDLAKELETAVPGCCSKIL